MITEMGDVNRGEMGAAEIAALFDRNKLRVARELRGLTQVQLAREVGSVTSASLSQFENGHSRPSAATLRRLAVALRVPLGFFACSAEPPRGEGTSGFFRSLRSTTPRDRQQALAFVELVRELTLQLEKHVALPDLDLPRAPQPVSEATTRDEIEHLAEETRKQWRISGGPIENVVQILERHGIVTTRFHVGIARVDAFSVPFPDRPVVVLGADKGLRDRSRFDGAHELAHLIIHDPSQAGSKTAETQAHQFAASFLMPAEDIRGELPARADWPTLLKLKAKWHVSIAALLMRAKTLEVMDERTYTQAQKTMSAKGWRTREPGDIGPPEKPILLRRAVDVAAEVGVTLDYIIRMSGLPEIDVHTILGHDDDRRPRVEF
jgi:Zn-dependent peptidase ImmA (M78 family)/DNA-binding XRE family transcriptional regulator